MNQFNKDNMAIYFLISAISIVGITVTTYQLIAQPYAFCVAFVLCYSLGRIICNAIRKQKSGSI